MYAPFFGLANEPFSIAPDPRYLFMSERHREALAHLLYGVGGGGGFVVLSGEIGAGKTTVCRCFLEQVPDKTHIAYIFNPKLTVTELLRTVCDEFGVPLPSGADTTVKAFVDPLNEYLLRTHAVGHNNVLIIDEAQNLSADVLEQLRLLTNLETPERKLLQIVLIGQPELRELLARPELEQLSQRVIARFHLGALSAPETDGYIRHRLGVAGLRGPLPFDDRALQRIHRLSGGVPRRINLLCDRALLGAYASGRHRVDRTIVDRAAAEVLSVVDLAARSAPRWQLPALAAASLGAAALAVAGMIGVRDGRPVAAVAAPASAASTPTVVAGASPVRAGAAAASNHSPDAPLRIDAAARDEKAAWRELAKAWRLELPAGADPCVAAQREGVQCFRSTGGSLALIRQLDRPGLVTLRDGGDVPAYALLTGLSGGRATVLLGGIAQTVSLQVLADVWRGDFATYWRAPKGYSGGVVVPRSGEAGDWLVEQLARAAGAASAPLDASESGARARIAAFQLAQGLKPDGLAGPTTFMQLNRAVGIDEPHLRGEPLAN